VRAFYSKNKLSIYRSGALSELIKWANERMSEGCTDFCLDVSWGFYSDIDDVEIEAFSKGRKNEKGE